MKLLKPKQGFLGIDGKNNLKTKSIIIPFGLEKTVTYGKGTRNGPKEIIKASHQVELFDEDLNCEPCKKFGFKTIKFFKIKNDMKSSLQQIEKIVKKVIENKQFPLVLGGEHSITPGCIKPFAEKYKHIQIVHFDAHADLSNSYNKNKFSHASAIRRCLDFNNISVLSLGIRNISKEEMNFYKKNKKKIKIFWAMDKEKWSLAQIKKIIKNKYVYLTFDVDSFDQSIMPATGTPEPGGLFWNETINLIKLVFKNSNVIGADINELAPIKGFESYNFLVAKLAYKFLSYKFFNKYE